VPEPVLAQAREPAVVPEPEQALEPVPEPVPVLAQAREPALVPEPEPAAVTSPMQPVALAFRTR
jgi:hypothetical protein